MGAASAHAPWVLLIDPDQEIAALLATLLAPACRVAMAADAAAARPLLATGAPCLIVAECAAAGVPALLAESACLPPVLLFCGALPDLHSARRAELVLLKPGISRRHLDLTLWRMLEACIRAPGVQAAGVQAAGIRAAGIRAASVQAPGVRATSAAEGGRQRVVGRAPPAHPAPANVIAN